MNCVVIIIKHAKGGQFIAVTDNDEKMRRRTVCVKIRVGEAHLSLRKSELMVSTNRNLDVRLGY